MRYCMPPDPNTRKPGFTPPVNSCDTHFHIFGPPETFPFLSTHEYTPPAAPLEHYLKMTSVIGVERAVVVQPSVHGLDNSATLDAIARSQGRFRGIGRIDDKTTKDELQKLHVGGIRGVRFHFMPHLGAPPPLDNLRRIMRLVVPRGWHIAIHMMGRDLKTYWDFITGIGARVVIDHMGRVDAAEGPDAEGFVTLRRLVDTGNVWVKLSGSDRNSKQPPPYRDAVALARILAEQAPERREGVGDGGHFEDHLR